MCVFLFDLIEREEESKKKKKLRYVKLWLSVSLAPPLQRSLVDIGPSLPFAHPLNDQ